MKGPCSECRYFVPQFSETSKYEGDREQGDMYLYAVKWLVDKQAALSKENATSEPSIPECPDASKRTNNDS